jgi:hypothetical protein
MDTPPMVMLSWRITLSSLPPGTAVSWKWARSAYLDDEAAPGDHLASRHLSIGADLTSSIERTKGRTSSLKDRPSSIAGSRWSMPRPLDSPNPATCQPDLSIMSKIWKECHGAAPPSPVWTKRDGAALPTQLA